MRVFQVNLVPKRYLCQYLLKQHTFTQTQMRSNLSKTQIKETKKATTSKKKKPKKWNKQTSNKIFLPQKLLKLVWLIETSYFPCLLLNIYQGIYLDNMVISWKRSLFKFKPIFFLDRAFFSYYKSVVH